MSRNKEDIFARDTVTGDVDFETAADVPQYLLETTPAAPPETAPPPRGVAVATPLGEIERTEKEAEKEKRRKRAEAKQRERKERDEARAIEREITEKKRKEQREITKRRRAKKILKGVENGDSIFGVLERLLLSAIPVLVGRHEYLVASLVGGMMIVVWYAKIKLGEGPLIKKFRETGKEELKEVLVKISTTFKN